MSRARHMLPLQLCDGPHGLEQRRAIDASAKAAGIPRAAWLRRVVLAAAGRSDLDTPATSAAARASSGGQARAAKYAAKRAARSG